MVSRRRSLLLMPLILTLAALPVLSGCHSAPSQTPLSAEALNAVSPDEDIPREALARAVDDLFTDPSAGETRALLVLRGGHIIAERYAPGYDAHTRFTGWSMGKSVTGVLIGVLVADGRLRLDEPVPIPLWQRSADPRGEITLRQLLQMRSGLAHHEEAEQQETSDTVRMLFLDGRDDMAAYAESQPLAANPGSTWNYSTATTVILDDLAARVLTDRTDPTSRRQAVAEYLRTRLLEPVGMHSMVGEYDAAGTLIGGSMMQAGAHDWARFGEFLRNGGAVQGAQIVPRAWIEFMTSPAPHNGGYGAQLWLNQPQSTGEEVLVPGRGPANIFACIGHLGQYVVVSPDQRLTIVRLGKTDAPGRAAVVNHLAQITGLFPSD